MELDDSFKIIVSTQDQTLNALSFRWTPKKEVKVDAIYCSSLFWNTVSSPGLFEEKPVQLIVSSGTINFSDLTIPEGITVDNGEIGGAYQAMFRNQDIQKPGIILTPGIEYQFSTLVLDYVPDVNDNFNSNLIVWWSYIKRK